MTARIRFVVILLVCLWSPPAACAAETPSAGEQFLRVLSLRDYNTRVVLLGSCLLGVSAGIVGTFMLLRKRALIGDVVGHASLPGIAIAFLVMEMIEPGSGKWVPGLMCGAFVSGLLGALCALAIRKSTRIKDDAALAIVLSIFFGAGVALFTIVQKIPAGNVAGLHQFVFGKTSSMRADDVKLFAWMAAGIVVVTVLFFKELTALCFDQEFARAAGLKVGWLDALLMLLIVSVSVIGLQSVGLLLVVALPLIPAAAARFWTNDIVSMTWISAGLGGLSAALGVAVSALFPRLATGPIIVLVGASLFAVSLLFGRKRGIVRRWWQQVALRRRVGRLDLMRACYESLEQGIPDGMLLSPQQLRERTLTRQSLQPVRAWEPGRLQGLLDRAVRENLLQRHGEAGYRLTSDGAEFAVTAARQHRLWELFLIRYADIAPSHVDRDADMIEHVLDPEILDELESALGQRYPSLRVPQSPHAIGERESRA
jgi:manganese/zinc/iron transport system permease protein